jgi:hypothetical protein
LKEFVDDLLEMFYTGGNFEKLLPPMPWCDASLDDFTTIISGMAHILACVNLSKTAVVRHHIIFVEGIAFILKLAYRGTAPCGSRTWTSNHSQLLPRLMNRAALGGSRAL